MLKFDSICRTCSLQGELQPLFIEDLTNPAEMLIQIVDVKVIQGDKYPQNICTSCLGTLKSAYLFKNQCQESHKKFEQYLLFNSKTESIEDSKEKLMNVVFIKEENHSVFSESVDDRLDLVNELENTSNEKTLFCVKCSIQFKNKKNYERHFKNHKKYTNQYSSDHLDQRSFKHSEDKGYACEKCNEKFKHQKNYKRHLKNHEQLNVCPVCGDQSSSKHLLEQHGRKHFNEKSSIDECYKKSDESDLKFSLKNINNDLITPNKTAESSHSKAKHKTKYLCDYCGSGYSKPWRLNAHIRSHTGEKPYKCEECHKSFTKKSQLSHHKRIHHSNEKPYKCDYCGKSFAISRWLKGHIRIHTNDKPFACHICNQNFREKHHLTRHQLVHTGEKPFSCNVCDKKFTQKSNLQSHMRTHTGEKPYVCSVCNAVFHDLSGMKKHQTKHKLNTPENQNMSLQNIKE